MVDETNTIPSSAPVSSMEASNLAKISAGASLDQTTSEKVLRQVEFYFSDSNLPRDDFLQKCIKENDEGLVSLPLICSFKRMRGHLGLPEAGPDKVPPETSAAVAEVLRKSPKLILSDDGSRVGPANKSSMSNERNAEVDQRSIAVGPICWTKRLKEIEEFFSLHIKAASIRLPRHPNKNVSCGFAVIELESEEEVSKALELKLTYDGVELEIKTRKELDEELEKSASAQNTIPNQNKERPIEHKNENRDVVEKGYQKGLIVSLSIERKAATIDGAPETAIKEQDKPDSANEQLIEADQVSREDLKEAFKQFGAIKFIDYERGDMSGFLRFDDAEAAQKARAAAIVANNGCLVIKGHSVIVDILEGQAEKEYWEEVFDKQQSARMRKQQKYKRGWNDRCKGRGKRQKCSNHQGEIGPNSKFGKATPFNDNGGNSAGKHSLMQSKLEANTILGKHVRFEEDDNV